MKMIKAVVRREKVNAIVEELKESGINGLTVYEVMGTGEGVGMERPYTVHHCLEVLVSDAQAGSAVETILEHAHTGAAGDGLVAVLPVENAVRVRSRDILPS